MEIVSKALEVLIATTLKNHVHQFNNQLRIQRNGGPIGLKLTGEVADCVMVEWDKKLNEKLKKVDIKPLVYTRFKDDITVITESVEKGTKLVDGELVMDDHKKMEDERKTDAKETTIVTSCMLKQLKCAGYKNTWKYACAEGGPRLPIAHSLKLLSTEE